MYGVSFLQKGGKPIKGEGDGTSDSVKKSVSPGSYIMPADSSAALGMSDQGVATPQKQGFGAPGYKGEQVPVNVSNGEFEIPPEQVHALGVQFLNKAKNATHTPVPEKRQGGELFFANGGLVDDPEKPKGFGVAPIMNRGQQAEQPQQSAPGIASGVVGGVKTILGGLALPSAAIADGVRSGAARLTGGDPATLEGGATKYRDMALGTAAEGVAQSSAAAEGLREKGRAALGVQPVMNSTESAGGQAGTQQPVAPATPSVPAPMADAAPTSQPSTPQNTGLGVTPWLETGIGADRQGGQIVARAGANGTAEFTNATASPEAVSGASPMPAGGFGVAPIMNRGQQAEQPGLGVGFARQGSAQNLGNGVGTFSQAEAGDAELALGRFERASQIRNQTIQESRRGQIGEGGGRVTVVSDSGRTPTVRERMLARLEERQAQTEATRSQAQQGAADGRLRRAAETQRMGTEQLNQQRLQQQVAEGELGMQDRQRLDQLRAQINDPALSEQQRAQALEAYNALAVTPDARLKAQQEAGSQQQRLISDLYKSFSSLETPPTIGEGQSARPMSFDEWLQPALRAIQGGGQQGAVAGRQAPAVGTQQGGYEFIGGDPASPSSWRRV